MTVAAILAMAARKSLREDPKSRLDHHQVAKVKSMRRLVKSISRRYFCFEKLSNGMFNIRQTAKGEDDSEDYTPTYTIL